MNLRHWLSTCGSSSLVALLVLTACSSTTTIDALPSPAQQAPSPAATASPSSPAPATSAEPTPEPTAVMEPSATPAPTPIPAPATPAPLPAVALEDLPSHAGSIRPLPETAGALVPTPFGHNDDLAASATGDTVSFSATFSRSDVPGVEMILTGEANYDTGYGRAWTQLGPLLDYEPSLSQRPAPLENPDAFIEEVWISLDERWSRGLVPQLNPRFADTAPDRWYTWRQLIRFDVAALGQRAASDLWAEFEDNLPITREDRAAGGWGEATDVRTISLDQLDAFDFYRAAGTPSTPFLSDQTVTAETGPDGRFNRVVVVAVERNVTRTVDIRFRDRKAPLVPPTIDETFPAPGGYLQNLNSVGYGWEATGFIWESIDDEGTGPFVISGIERPNDGVGAGASTVMMLADDYASATGIDAEVPADAAVIERIGDDPRFLVSKGLVPEIMPWWAEPDVDPEETYYFDPFSGLRAEILSLGRRDMALWARLRADPVGVENPEGWDVFRTTKAELTPEEFNYFKEKYDGTFLNWLSPSGFIEVQITVGADEEGRIEHIRVFVLEGGNGGELWDFAITAPPVHQWTGGDSRDAESIVRTPAFDKLVDDFALAQAGGDFEPFYQASLEQYPTIDHDRVPEHVTVIADYVGGLEAEHAQWQRWPTSPAMWGHEAALAFSRRDKILCFDAENAPWPTFPSDIERLWTTLPEGMDLVDVPMNGGNNLAYTMSFYAFDGPRPDNDPCVWPDRQRDAPN